VTQETITALTGIDVEGLRNLQETAKKDPSTGRKTLKATTDCEGGFRNLTTIRSLEPVLVSEPCALLGDDAAPHPSEIALTALGSCISVGLLANATAHGVTLSQIRVAMEGDIDISAVWGVGDTPDDKVPGFIAVRWSRCDGRCWRPQLAAADGPLQVIDVRGPDEVRSSGAVAGATLVQLPELIGRMDELNRSVPTVVYCAGGYRSSIAASTLRRHGFTDVSDLLGGFGAWGDGMRATDPAVRRGSPPVARSHHPRRRDSAHHW
jgi:rhodanese-related sulfurtransferase